MRFNLILKKFKSLAKIIINETLDLINPLRFEYIDDQDIWQRVSNCPLPLYDAASVFVNHKFYVFGGYSNIHKTNDAVFIYNVRENTWEVEKNVPPNFMNSHSAICTDGNRYIYYVSGQIGPQCAPCVPLVFCFDTFNRTWSELPALPEARYAGTMQYIENCLYFVGGAQSDRVTPSDKHWCLPVSGNRPESEQWKELAPCPLAAMHRGSISYNNEIYIIAGQQGDFKSLSSKSPYECTGKTTEYYFRDVYKYNLEENAWYRLKDLPLAVSHTDCSIVEKNGFIWVLGGQAYKDSTSYQLRLTDYIQVFDIAKNNWYVCGRLPYRVKALNSFIYNDELYSGNGQRDYSSFYDYPNRVTNEFWKCKLKDLAYESRNPTGAQSFSDKYIILIAHELSLTGAPLLLLETAKFLLSSGARIGVYVLNDQIKHNNFFIKNHIPVLPIENAMEDAVTADAIIANTAVCGIWVRKLLALNPKLSDKLIWWIHENEINEFNHFFLNQCHVQNLLFDSLNQRQTWQGRILQSHSNTKIIHPGIRKSVEYAASHPISFEDKNTLRKQLGINSNDFLLLSIGSFCPKKGQSLLVESAGSIIKQTGKTNLKVLIIGFTHEKEKKAFYETCTYHERNAVGHGKLLLLEQEDLTKYYAISDAFVMNTQNSGEPFGMVTIEALAFQLPVLATNAGGTLEIIKDNVNGLLHPVGKQGNSILMNNIQLLMRDAVLRKKLGENGRSSAIEYFSSARFSNEFEKYLSEILSRSVSQN